MRGCVREEGEGRELVQIQETATGCWNARWELCCLLYTCMLASSKGLGMRLSYIDLLSCSVPVSECA